ncbi:hypothetical protein ACH3XW_10280 [Acanthocheilonema viteae]
MFGERVCQLVFRKSIKYDEEEKKKDERFLPNEVFEQFSFTFGISYIIKKKVSYYMKRIRNNIVQKLMVNNSVNNIHLAILDRHHHLLFHYFLEKEMNYIIVCDMHTIIV